jgi:hypothetical protein
LARVRRAHRAAKEAEEQQKEAGKKEPPTTARASTTDPEARLMRMADGGLRLRATRLRRTA